MIDRNEVTSLTEVLKMIGGNREYMTAIMVAAFVNMYKEEVTLCVWPEYDDSGNKSDMIEVDIWHKDDAKNISGPLISVIIPKKYEELFA